MIESEVLRDKFETMSTEEQDIVTKQLDRGHTHEFFLGARFRDLAVGYSVNDDGKFTTAAVLADVKDGEEIMLFVGCAKRNTYGQMADEFDPDRARAIALSRAVRSNPIRLVAGHK